MINSIELFSGTGGLALGLQESGFNHLALFEWDKHSCDNIKSNIAARRCGYVKDWNVFQTDVRTVDFSRYEGKAQLVSGGPPCQPFSLGGKGLAYEDRRDMFPEAVRAVREIKPKAFVFENVRGLLRKTFSTYFNYIILQLSYPEIVADKGMSWQEHLSLLEKCHTSSTCQTLRYNVSFRLVNAADYGVPQQRYRVIIVGFREDIDAQWSFPEATHSADFLYYSQWISKEYWAEHGIECPKRCPFTNKQLTEIRSRCEGLFTEKRWRTVRDAFQGMEDPATEKTVMNNHGFHGWSKSYAGHTGSVLDLPSKTIKAGAHGVPGGENTIILDDGRMRYYTVRESARLQTFPDSFTFGSSWSESMRQIGNAVPVMLGQVVGKSIASHLQ